MAACSQCADFITHKRPVIEEAESIGEESAAVIAVLLPRIRTATRRTAEAFQQGKEHREKVEKRVLAARYIARKDSLFSKYDKDGDGYMTLDDVIAYANCEFNFDIPPENLERIERKLFKGPDGTVGLPRENFQLVRAAVGIARAEAIGKRQREDRIVREAKEAEESAERQEKIATRKAELQDLVKERAKALIALEPSIKAAESVAEALAGEAGQLGSDDLKAKSDSVDATTTSTREQLDEIRDSIKAILAEVNEVPELAEFTKGVLVPLSSRSDVFDMRLRKACETAASGRQLAQYMALSEYEGLWTEVVVKLRASVESVEGKSVDDLFDHIAGSDITVPENTPGADADIITTSEIQTFLKTHNCAVEIEQLNKLFGRNAGGFGAEEGDKAIEDAPKEGDAEGKADDAKADDAKADNAEDGKKETEDANGEAKEATEESKAEESKVDEKKEETDVKDEESKKEDGKAKKEDGGEDLESLTVDKLKEKLKAAGLKVSGNKAELISRLKDKKAEDKKAEDKKAEDKKDEDMKDEDKKDEDKKDEDKKDDAEAKTENGDDAKDGEAEKPKDVGTLDIAAAAAAAAAKLAGDSREKAQTRSLDGLQITRADFKRIIRMYYKVVRHCVLSDNLQIEQSSQIRRMDVGEVIEVHRGPTLDTSVNVYRVFGKCIRDGINGWATIAGNTGVTFLMPGGRIFTVKIGVNLTEELKDVEGEKTIRKLNEGEVLEVLEWARTSRSALGVTRIRARAQLDNSIGWATTVGNDEQIYLEAM
jgi:hypothetical protein